ncbi:DUF4232 domain-containing protein [Arthrobacter sp. YAF17]|uniref:DUF4232 domain-containing protein n=1 Tax=Arthrobacter sp. YAF17 TaxID=3233077 RepID=UPI003F8FA72B
MTAQRITNRLAFTTAAAAAVLFLAGCGAGTPQSQASSTPAASPTSSESQPASSGAAAADSGASTPTPAVPAPAGPALCKAAGLTATTDSTGGGAAGSVYMQLLLTNTGSEPCLLFGFAGVSLTAGPDGDPIGAAAARDTTPPTEVLLEPGQAGAATLRYTQARNYPDCTVVAAAGFRVYPPEDTASLFVAQPRDACSNAGINLLTVGAFQAQ